MRKATLRRILMRPTFPLELQLQRLDYLGSNGRMDVYNFLVREAASLSKRPEIRPPLITGDDLIELGMKPGAALGKMLVKIRDMQLQEELKTAEEARAWARAKLDAKARARTGDGGR